jgi:uroporphyrinogen-III synthase
MKTSLYLGTDPSHYVSDAKIIHFPIIEIIPRTLADEALKKCIERIQEFTHIVVTSKNAVRVFFNLLRSVHKDLTFLNTVSFLCIGSVTAKYLALEGFCPSVVAKVQTQEGLVQQLDSLNWQDANVFFPRSSLSRNVLSAFLITKNIKHSICDLYDTITTSLAQNIDLNIVDEIVFTSPSTVKAFIEKFGPIPTNKKLVAIGPITRQTLHQQIFIA